MRKRAELLPFCRWCVWSVKSALFGVCALLGVFVCPWRVPAVVARFNGFVARASCFRCCAFPLGMLSRSKFSPLLAFGGVRGVIGRLSRFRALCDGLNGFHGLRSASALVLSVLLSLSRCLSWLLSVRSCRPRSSTLARCAPSPMHARTRMGAVTAITQVMNIKYLINPSTSLKIAIHN